MYARSDTHTLEHWEDTVACNVPSQQAALQDISVHV